MTTARSRSNNLVSGRSISATYCARYLSPEDASAVEGMRKRIGLMRDMWVRSGYSKELFELAVSNEEYFIIWGLPK